MRRCTLGFGFVTLLAFSLVFTVGAQDPNAKPNYGQKELKAGFTPDPFLVKVEAGGPIKTNLGGVTAHVTKEPDFRLRYTAGAFPLTFKVVSDADTTLLINLPDGTWVANDDADGTLNPRVTLGQPKSGDYEIWVGTFDPNINPKAILIITELK